MPSGRQTGLPVRFGFGHVPAAGLRHSMRRGPFLAQSVPLPPSINYGRDRLHEFPHDRDMLASPRARLASGARIHGDVGRIEPSQRRIEPAHCSDICQAGKAEVTVVAVRAHPATVSNTRSTAADSRSIAAGYRPSSSRVTRRGLCRTKCDGSVYRMITKHRLVLKVPGRSGGSSRADGPRMSHLTTTLCHCPPVREPLT